MDRVIWAMGRKRQLDFTLFRPFNWIGAGLITSTPQGRQLARVTVLRHIGAAKIKLVDSGTEARFHLYDDGAGGVDENYRQP
jgi:hypothetical protein